jgi:hypothetical protein
MQGDLWCACMHPCMPQSVEVDDVMCMCIPMLLADRP